MAAGEARLGGGRRPFVAGAIAMASALVAAPGSGPAGRSAGAVPPSVLLITIDTLRADHVGCYGDARIATPAIDALAAEGARFEHAYAQVPLTLPSHVTILTGTYPMLNGVRDFTTAGLPPSLPTLAEILRRHGYHTAAMVSSFALDRMWGLDRGFDLYDDNLEGEIKATTDVFLAKRPGDRTTDRLLEWLGRPGNMPFFLWLHLYDPHSPYRPPEPYASKYPGRPYDGEIAFDDAQVGRVLARIKELRLYDQTAIILLSDHGESLGEHGEDEHGFFIYNATLRVPLIVKLPNASYGSRDTTQGSTGTRGKALGLSVIDSPVGAVDVAPTIAALCSMPAAETRTFQGRSLLPLLTGSAGSAPADVAPASSRPESRQDGGATVLVYAESYYPRDSFGWHPLRAVVSSRYKYIEAPRPELYDLEHDPSERANLAGNQASIAAALRERLRTFEKRYSGPAASATAQLDSETVERLRSLGYVSFTAPAPSTTDSQLADPKDKIGTLRRILRASDLRRWGRYSEAEQMLTELEAVEPKLYVVPYERGENFLAWSKPKSAIEELGKALSLNPAFDQAALALGRAHFLLGEDAQAATAIELGLHFNPRNYLARLALALVYERENLPAQAAPEFAQALDLHAENIEARAAYAIILAKLGKYHDALPQFERARAAHYRKPVFFNYLGITYAQLGETAKAIAAYEQAVTLDPDYAVAYLNLALQYRKQNQPEKARSYYQKTCELNQALCRQYAGQFGAQ